jgi:hypothetical protein
MYDAAPVIVRVYTLCCETSFRGREANDIPFTPLEPRPTVLDRSLFLPARQPLERLDLSSYRTCLTSLHVASSRSSTSTAEPTGPPLQPFVGFMQVKSGTFHQLSVASTGILSGTHLSILSSSATPSSFCSILSS